VIQDYLTVSALGTFLISLPYVYKSLRKLSGLNDTIQSSRGAAERIENIFSESRVYNVDLNDGEEEPTFDNEIVLKDVGYHYPGYDEMALREINLTLSRGDGLALVGPSGVGKSTFTDLLMRFIDPTTGEIRVDGLELSEYDLTQYRRLFGLVTQKPILFDATISENISYGRDQVSQSDVIRAAQQAEAKKFIDDLPEGFETHVGEKGVKLSGGEKQRIALARALAGDPQILVLDEATSNIDSRSEKMIIDAIENLPTEMTLLTISHALATVQFADEIVVLNDHTIEDVGTHSALLEESPTYRELYEHQVDDLQTAFG
jgi:ABC-type multidrug transport system fused ATPase/permease subunit